MINRWLSGVIFASLLAIPFTASAEPQNKPADVRIVVDISGSMKETDPNNLRVPAVNLLVDLLPDNATGGIWTFGHYVNMLVPLAPVDNAWRTTARKEAATINSAGLYTNLTEALARASWKISADSGFNQTLILLTDGKIDMPGSKNQDVNASERERLMKQVLPVYAKAGARIHTVGLSDGADKKLLQEIALETGGLYLEAQDADALLKVFLKAFDRAVPAEQVPLVDNRFEIDASVKEFTALIFRKSGGKETVLITPSGRRIDLASSSAAEDVRWHKELNFDLITVTTPEVGSWRAEADVDPDNRVQILSDLKLSVEGLPASIFSGNPVDLEIALKNGADLVSEKAILGLTDFTLKVTAPDGRSGSKLLSDPESLPVDGVFRESMTRLSQVGEYQFEVTAVGRTFQRRQVLTASLLEPLAVSVTDVPEEERVHIRVSAESQSVDTSLSRVIAKITSPDGSSLINNMTYDAATNGWAMDLVADKGQGRYEVVLNIRGVTSGGATFRSKPEDVVREFPLTRAAAGAAPVTPPVSEEEPATAAEAVEVADVAPPAQDTPAPAAEQENAPPPAEDIAPDLASRFAEQAQEASVEDAEDGGIAWWIYVLLAAGNLLLFGGAGAWWFMKKRKSAAAPAAAPVAASTSVSDLSGGDEGLTDDDFSGDFDSFADSAEEEIPMPGSTPVRSPSSMGGDTNISVSLDDDFAIDPDPGAADEDWGEFDADDKK